LVSTVASSALGDEPLPFPGISPGNEPVVEPGHWTLDPGRPFIALRADLGYLYFKPRFSFGYGKPFTLWGGLDVVPFVTPDAAGGYGGLRLQLDWFEIRAGARFVHAFNRQYLTPQPTYSIVDLAENTGHPSDYLALEVEASAAIPAGPGDILALATVSSIQFVPAGYNVFDETLHVVVSPPAVYRQRLGYSLILGRERIARLGLVGEVIEIPDRNAQVVRAGLIGSFDIDDHLQLIATVLVPVWGPDSLGLLGADYTELGIRYRWATGHSHVPKNAPSTLP
jgi:hypothetical protein